MFVHVLHGCERESMCDICTLRKFKYSCNSRTNQLILDLGRPSMHIYTDANLIKNLKVTPEKKQFSSNSLTTDPSLSVLCSAPVVAPVAIATLGVWSGRSQTGFQNRLYVYTTSSSGVGLF